MSVEELRAKAKKALLEGKYKQALEAYAELHKAEPSDLRTHVKVAELREKTGDTGGAVKDYIAIANAYAEQGFVVQAIAINKIILRLDSARTEIKEKLKRLSSERGDDWAITTVTPQDKLQAAEISGMDKAKLSFERTPLLSGLAGDELEAFIDSLQLDTFSADTTIYSAGDSGDNLYLIGMGVVRLEAVLGNGQRRPFSRLGEGDFFGEHAFMGRRKHHDAAVAETDVTVLVIDRKTFDAWVERYPNIQAIVEDFYTRRVLARVLAITPVFEGVPPEARMALADRFKLQTCKKGDEIVREGEQGDSFFLIRSGEVHIFTSDMKDKSHKIDLGRLEVGSFFGEVALLTDKPRTATVVAANDVELMMLTRQAFTEIVDKYPSVRKVVEAYQRQRVQDTIKALTQRDISV